MCRRGKSRFIPDKEFSDMKSHKQDTNQPIILTLNESTPDYEKAELDLLRDALNTSYTERFIKMMNLIKMNKMFRAAKITRPD